MPKTWKKLLNFKCTCCGNCCREPIVLVTDEDIIRIIAHTGQVANDIVRFYKPEEIAWGKKQPGWIEFRSGRRIMGLRRNQKGCQYLSKDDLCTIYEHRPVTCRRYPFDVELGSTGNIELLSISQSVECIYELDGHNTVGQIKALCNWEEREEIPYYDKIETWNKKKKNRSRNQFLKHLGF